VESPGIQSVQFSGFENNFGWFDNLQVDFLPVPTLPTTLGRVKAHYR
jgi:hypothetical protein